MLNHLQKILCNGSLSSKLNCQGFEHSLSLFVAILLLSTVKLCFS